MSLVRHPRHLSIVRENLGSYVLINVIFYGGCVVSALAAIYAPELQQQALARAYEFLDHQAIAGASSAYVTGSLVAAIGWTFIINLTFGAIMTTTLPSLIIPFSGILMLIYRAIEIGFIFAPTGAVDHISLHGITIIVEGQAYVLAAFGGLVMGKMLIRPQASGLISRWEAYKAGFLLNARLYVPITLILALSAVYEAITLIYVMTPK